jgi:hypothetical protein
VQIGVMAGAQSSGVLPLTRVRVSVVVAFSW